MAAIIVYILCALTCGSCAFLLLRHFKRSRSKLLFWSGICFVCLALSNVILFVDLVVLPDIDLGVYRGLTTLVGLGVLLYGLITETT
jgi:hypothetical protein